MPNKIKPKFKISTVLSTYFKQFVNSSPSLFSILKWLFICLILGLTIGTASAIFLLTLDYATQFREANSWLILALPLAGFLIGAVYYYYGKSVESGTNLLLQNIEQPTQRIPFRMVPFVFIGTLATHLFGGSAGREGTALQMAGAIADQLTAPLKLSDKERSVLLIAAIAAGFGSVFGTPLAGAIFAIEVIYTGRLNYKAILPALLAAFIATKVATSWPVKHTHYAIDVIPSLALINILYAILAGIAFGLCALLFTQLMHTVSAFFNTKISYPPLRSFVGGILIVLLIYMLGTTNYIGLGIPTIIQAFKSPALGYVFAIKIGLTVITLAAGFKGGEVTPLFFIGATLGSALSCILPLPIALLACMGFVAVFAGTTNTPFACTLMAIELFGLPCGIFIFIACFTAYFVSGNSSIYTSQKTEKFIHVKFLNRIKEKLGYL